MFGIKKEPEKKGPMTSVMIDEPESSIANVEAQAPRVETKIEEESTTNAEIIASELLESGVYRYFVLSRVRFKPGPINIGEA
jgi:hypothetical protein